MYGSYGPGDDSGVPGGGSGGPGGGSGEGEGAYKVLGRGVGLLFRVLPKELRNGILALTSVRCHWVYMKIGRGETSGCPAPSYTGQTFEKQPETLKNDNKVWG